ncbi:nicotinate (nicotinamide) nucleotide adenylyltransferase [Mycoplasmatota bacterium WC44]
MLVVFGGVFNPPTLAHYKAAEVVIERLNVDRFVFLPVGLSYELKNVEDDLHRVNMLKLLADKLKAEISMVEIESKEYLGTYETLKSMDEPDLKFLIGSDNLHDLHKWKNATNLLEEFEFIVLSRNESVEDIINSNIFLRDYKDKFIIIDDFHFDISSTEYKKHLNEKLLLKEVSKYVEMNGLYRR